MTARGAGRIDPLDGLRGLAALWVFVGHSLNLTVAWIPIVGRPLLAVDLFMLLSGALMAYQAEVREAREPMAAPSTWLRFWTRRFFRIAPVFYLAFVVAMLAGPWIGEMRGVLAAAGGGAVDTVRYNDHGPGNILLHLTFLFGLIPEYANRSPLPDWSISLEMQFYLAFPFIFLLLRKIGFVAGSVLLTVAAAALWLPFGSWLAKFDPDTPALLSLKLNMFLAGMLVMKARTAGSGGARWMFVGVATALAAIPVAPVAHWSELVIRVLSVLVAAAAIIPGLLGRTPLETLAGWGRAVLGSAPLKLLGDVSYGVYLIHLLVLVPVAALVEQRLPGAAPLVQAGAAFGLSALIVYPLGWIAYQWIEKPGISLGRRAVDRMSPRSPSRSPADA
jgi:peptidoglycan/LPS O-acetylase OafA/YrhL